MNIIDYLLGTPFTNGAVTVAPSNSPNPLYWSLSHMDDSSYYYDEGIHLFELLRWIESVRLAKCIYNKGCTADDTPTIPDTMSTEGKLVIASDDVCEKITLKYWDSIEVGDNMCNSMTSLSLSDYQYLSSIIVGSSSFQGLTSLTLSNIPTLTSFSVGIDSFKVVTALRIESTLFNL